MSRIEGARIPRAERTFAELLIEQRIHLIDRKHVGKSGRNAGQRKRARGIGRDQAVAHAQRSQKERREQTRHQHGKAPACDALA